PHDARRRRPAPARGPAVVRIAVVVRGDRCGRGDRRLFHRPRVRQGFDRRLPEGPRDVHAPVTGALALLALVPAVVGAAPRRLAGAPPSALRGGGGLAAVGEVPAPGRAWVKDTAGG